MQMNKISQIMIQNFSTAKEIDKKCRRAAKILKNFLFTKSEIFLAFGFTTMAVESALRKSFYSGRITEEDLDQIILDKYPSKKVMKELTEITANIHNNGNNTRYQQNDIYTT